MTEETRLYGASDDLIEMDGGYRGEVGFFNPGDDERKALVVFDDGTVATISYGKGGMAIWGIELLKQGALFDRLEPCTDEDADPHSDQMFLKPGVKHAWVATEWSRAE